MAEGDGHDVLTVLLSIWYFIDCICGKRLVPVLTEVLRKLEQFRELTVDEEVRGKLKNLSAATIARLLSPEREKYALKGRSKPKPDTPLKHQIPIQTSSDWKEQRLGFVEADLVGHEGGYSR